MLVTPSSHLNPPLVDRVQPRRFRARTSIQEQPRLLATAGQIQMNATPRRGEP